MNEGTQFPTAIPREEALWIRQEAARVLEDGQSRVVLLYGPGGVGKTWLVRELAQAGATDETTTWLEPIDVDDSRYWLLSSLEREVAKRLDPGNHYFGPYLEYLSRLPRYMRPRIGHETVVSHLGRIKREFVQCYERYVRERGKAVVIALDTVEAIRGMDLRLTLTQWMKALPGTLFILSGRPMPANGDGHDPLERELQDPHQPLPVKTVELAEFTEAAAVDYLNAGGVAGLLEADEMRKLILLTRGHPLWLAFTVDYLLKVGMPEEAQVPLSEIERDLPYKGTRTPKGQGLHEAFRRRLVTPYRDADFWHEAIKRLVVVRQSVNQPIWEQLVGDLDRPATLKSWGEAWDALRRLPWIRSRANRSSVTLHDAVAEELALRIIPVHDQDEQWRRQLWRRAVRIYEELTDGPGAELARRLDQVMQVEGEAPLTVEEKEFIETVARLDTEKRELDQLRAARLYYQLLSDPRKGCRLFLDLFAEASQQHDVLLQELIVMEMRRFLPNGPQRQVLGEVIGGAVDKVQRWLKSTSPDTHLEIGLSIARFLVTSERPEAAVELLDKLPVESADPGQRYRLSILRGDACMRIRGRVKEAAAHFGQALLDARALTGADRQQLIAAAQKELGFYYRNLGLWQEADDAYQEARDTISEILTARSPAAVREAMASIQTNWAYVKGLRGSYGEGRDLVESAITVRQRVREKQGEGMSWSVRGELYRYERQFQTAWESYLEAERIFHGLRNWSWLGLVYQEQAICLFQAARAGIELVPDQPKEAERRVRLALDICRDQAVRGYPAALNRAGRILGRADFRVGLQLFDEAIDQSLTLSDGRSWFANLIDYVEFSYQAWVDTGQDRYRQQIDRRAPEIGQVISEYTFQDLEGRWHLLQGHLGIRDALASGRESELSEARGHYAIGFLLIAQGYVGSHGAEWIASEFKRFRELFGRLRPDVQAAWEEELRRAWSGSTSLLARLDQLY
jgi:tetratricopeptide (TPR) repeat protein